jgi:hypothetical protein
MRANKKSPEEIERNAAAASAKARAGGPRPEKPRKVKAGTFRGIRLDGTEIVLHGQRYPVKGAQAGVSEFASGLLGRKHTVVITVTLAGPLGQLSWTQTDVGTMARVTYRQAVAFAAAVNTAGR